MKNSVQFFVSLIIAVIALLCMSINWFIVPMPDWVVRMVGIVMMVDLVILVYSGIKKKTKENI